MSLLFRLLIVALILSSCNELATIEAGKNTTIATWNLEWYPDRDQSAAPSNIAAANIEKISAVIAEMSPDIFCAQEIKDPEAFSGMMEALGYSVQFISEFRGAQEIAIASKFDADLVGQEEFQKAEATPPRGMVFALFRLADYDLLVYSLHLKSNFGGIVETTPQREESARQIVDHVQRLKKEESLDASRLVVILAGDFNTDPFRPDWKEDRTLRILEAAGFQSTFSGQSAEYCVTWLSDGRYPDATFDHILIQSPKAIQVAPSSTWETTREVSDHRPVVLALDNEN
jgi:endonuclease/exonuclease/phosphatase family metal-dependent hydrolase